MVPHRSRPDPRQGVFETLGVRDGGLLELEAHLARLRASVAALYGAPLPAGLAALLAERAHGLRLGRLRVSVAPVGSGELTTDVRTAAVEPVAVFPGWSRAVTLAPLVVPGGLGPHKWSDRAVLERAEAGAGGAVALVLDGDGLVLEASRANVFVVEGETIATPPADGRILPGVTRARVLELATVKEEPLSLERLLAADEVFLTGSVRGVEPVRACAGAREWPEGPRTPLLARELRRRWEQPS